MDKVISAPLFARRGAGGPGFALIMSISILVIRVEAHDQRMAELLETMR